MKHSFYKYFDKQVHADLFLEGKVRFRTVAYYRDFEEEIAKQVIGDKYEGTRLFRQPNGLEITNVTQNTSSVINADAHFQAKADEIFVFCVSLSLNDSLVKEFGATTIVEICDKREFIRRLIDKLPVAARDKGQYSFKKIEYYRPEDLPGPVWAQPHLIITAKRNEFAYQNEYRFAYTKSNALAFENIQLQISSQNIADLSRKTDNAIETLEIGDINDICQKILV